MKTPGSVSTAKLIAFAAAVSALGLLPYLHYENYQSAGLRRSLSQAPTLLPPQVGDFTSVERWTHPIDGYTGIEQGAAYESRVHSRKVQYDMWLGNLGSGHNGIACYLAQGSRVLWQKSRNVKAGDSDAVFGLALLRDDSVEGPRLKLVAATECSFSACQENALVAHGWEFTGQSLARFFKPDNISLPLSITLTGGDDAAGQAQLLDSLEHFVQGLALRPVRAFSALESGLAPQT